MSADPPPDAVSQLLGEIHAGGGLSLAAAGKLIPGSRGPGSTHPSTLHRWVRKGVRTTDGRVVKLGAVRVGGRWLTSRGAVARFVAALTTTANPTTTVAPPATRTPASRGRASDRAARELQRRGA